MSYFGSAVPAIERRVTRLHADCAAELTGQVAEALLRPTMGIGCYVDRNAFLPIEWEGRGPHPGGEELGQAVLDW
eukprot:4361263-Amphidinium_carterae.2